VIGYAAPPEHAYAQTLAALADALQARPSAGATSSRTTASTASRR
jgi:hypothetical protein